MYDYFIILLPLVIYNVLSLIFCFCFIIILRVCWCNVRCSFLFFYFFLQSFVKFLNYVLQMRTLNSDEEVEREREKKNLMIKYAQYISCLLMKINVCLWRSSLFFFFFFFSTFSFVFSRFVCFDNQSICMKKVASHKYTSSHAYKQSNAAIIKLYAIRLFAPFELWSLVYERI